MAALIGAGFVALLILENRKPSIKELTPEQGAKAGSVNE